ncbi:TlpA disulfide reductase family protein [Roseibium sp.]|uniref:TlpA disulfide reductase family protein n=1 Tax=Roseibium sp. TaxID=1936156 RepID=UPI003D0B75B3
MRLLNRRDMVMGLAATAALSGPAFASEPEFRRLGLAEPPFAIDTAELGVPDLDGRIHSLEDYRGKTLIVSFWATWCPPCRKEMPTLARLNRELGSDKFAVLAVNVGDKDKKVRAFLEQAELDGLPILIDDKGTLPGKWYLRGLPVTYILNGSGDVILGAIGERVWDAPEMIAALKGLG